MSRPVDAEYPVTLGFKAPYSAALQKLTGLSTHQGIDYGCPSGTIITAGVNGWWLGAGWHRGYGYMAQILFAVGRLWWKRWYIARYAHLTANSERFDRLGVAVSKDSAVAFSDNTGASTGSHLHFELWRAEKIKGAWVRVELVNPSLVVGNA